MSSIKNDIFKASQQIGLTDSQIESLWIALQEIETNKPKLNFSNALLCCGSIIAFSSMTWFYSSNLGSIKSLFISIVYAIIFFASGAYLWHAKKLKVPGGLLSSLGIIMVPLIVFSIQNVMNWLPAAASATRYVSFFHSANGMWVPMEICTLIVASLVLYFIRYPFITVLIYFVISFFSMDIVRLFTSSWVDYWVYCCVTSIMIGTLLCILGFVLYRKNQDDFGFWSYLFGMFLCWSGLTCWDTETEWGHFTYFLINFGFLLVSSLFHRKIFTFFGSVGIIVYVAHLSFRFSDSLMFSFIAGTIGFAAIILATILLRSKKIRQTS